MEEIINHVLVDLFEMDGEVCKSSFTGEAKYSGWQNPHDVFPCG